MVLVSIVSMYIGVRQYPPAPQISALKSEVSALIREVKGYLKSRGASEKPEEKGIETSCGPTASGRVDAGSYRFRLLNEKAPFQVRDGAGAVVHQGNLLLIGGWNPHDETGYPRVTSNDVWTSEDGGVTWTETKPNTFDEDFESSATDFEGRHTAGYVSLNGMVYIVGGDANQGYHINDVYRSPDGASWERVIESPPWAPRALHLTFVKDGYICVVGGQTMPEIASREVSDEVYYRDA